MEQLFLWLIALPVQYYSGIFKLYLRNAFITKNISFMVYFAVLGR